MIRISDSRLKKILQTNILNEIINSVLISDVYKNKAIYLDIFLDIKNNDKLRKEFVKDIVTLELSELKNGKNYKINEYIKLVKWQASLSEVKNRSSRKQSIKNLKILINKFPKIRDFIDATYIGKKNIEEYFRNEKNFSDLLSGMLSGFEELNSVLTEMFSYKIISPYRAKIINIMGISFCPYCNMCDLIIFSGADNKQNTTAEIDHLFLQSKYRLFGASYGNFIPSCKNCNQSFKGQSLTEILNPRESGFEDNAYFYIPDVSKLLLKFEPEFKIEMKIEKDRELIQNSIETFKIIEQYNNKAIKKEIIESFYKVRNYNTQFYRKMLSDYGDEAITKLEFRDKLGIEPLGEDLINTRLGKLKTDLINRHLNK